jgi:hypothetical protein
MTTDYISNGASQADVLAMFYSVPLAEIYREKPHLVFRADGRIHGHFAATQTVFVFTPSDYETWQQAYAANVELFLLT